MTFETKYNEKEIVWVMKDNVPRKAEITYITIYIRPGQKPEVNYTIYERGGNSAHGENYLFRTKQELLNSFIHEDI